MSFAVKSCLYIPTSALAERSAMSSQIFWPDGASAACGRLNPRASPTTWDVAAVPRKWHPPPGLAQVLQVACLAYSSVTSPWAKRAPIDCIVPKSSPLVGGSVTPPGTTIQGRFCIATNAIIIAGSPLSQLATPSTPFRLGRLRIRRRKTVDASLRYGRLSIMPGVPWVRPSHGSEQKPANGM